jgi:hypothetical protein
MGGKRRQFASKGRFLGLVAIDDEAGERMR